MSQWDQLRTVALTEINARFSCPLCRGYIIDCVTAEECGHAYCRSCIARHIANGTVTCPKCDHLINQDEPGEPFEKLKPDPVLQRLIFKLVPNLVSKETERRAAYHGSEKVARKEVKQSVGEDALFFNDRSCVCIELRQRLSASQARSVIQQTPQESCFLRMELSSPLCILVDYVKLRTGTNSNVCLSSSPKAPVLDHDLRLVDLAYLIAWDMSRPLLVYYELIDSDNQPAGRLQPLTPMLRTESNPRRSSDMPANNRSQTSSSVLVMAQSRPAYPPARQPPATQTGPSSSTDQPLPPAKLKLKFNKNHIGNWQAISSGATTSGREAEETLDSRTDGKVDRRHKKPPGLFDYDKTAHSGKRPFDQTRDPVIAPKVAKVHPFPTYSPTPDEREQQSEDSAKNNYNDPYGYRSDETETEILKSIGLVPLASSSSNGNHILSIRHILQGQR